MLAKNPPAVYRVVFIGDSSVGKTSIISRLVNNTYNNDEQTTVGAMFVMHSEVINNDRVEMQIWDTAGQEKFRSLGPIYYRSAQVGVMVIDVTSKQSLDHSEEWIDNFKRIAGRETLMVIAANKCDMTDDRQVTDEMINKWTGDNGIKWFLTSAKEGTGITTMFQYIAKYLYEHRTEGVPVSTTTVAIGDQEKEKKEKKSCC